MKRLFLLLSFTALIIAGKAQDNNESTKNSAVGFHFAGGLSVGLPIGDFGDIQSIGLGVEIQPEYMVSDMVSIVGSVGYTSFFGKDVDLFGITFKTDAVGLIPILAGVRVYPSPQFFIGGKLGVGILTGNGNSESAFDYQPQIGYNADKFQIDLGYNALTKDGSTLSALMLSFLYKFK